MGQQLQAMIPAMQSTHEQIRYATFPQCLSLRAYKAGAQTSSHLDSSTRCSTSYLCSANGRTVETQLSGAYTVCINKIEADMHVSETMYKLGRHSKILEFSTLNAGTVPIQ